MLQDGVEPPAGGDLRFSSVSFGYDDQEGDDANEADAANKVLDAFDLTIPHAKVTALVGPSGSGKTTVLSLLERFYPVEEGALTIGDLELDALALTAWRRRIGYVPQEAPLLAGTIRQNLVYGLEEEPSDQEIDQALRAARADGFVAQLKKGLEAEVGERGVRLSGGQRQRLAIARAFLKDPQILMLDEATANLDSESEEAVREALADLMRGRTTVIVAHRLSTVVDADQIAMIEDGRVTGIGSHQDLLANHFRYRRLVERQAV